MIVLGIETSCDETAAAIVSAERRIMANVILSQLAEHRPYGGVVPEIAARAHLDRLDGVVVQALKEAGLSFDDLDAVAATAGPGLIGGVIVGTSFAKAIAFAKAKRFVAVNHLEGHALTCRLTDDVAFPYLLLLISGGHCQILIVEAVGRYRRLGGTIDDAIGEAFDKTAKMLGLGFPGGPAVEAWATQGDSSRFSLPRPLLGRAGCDFSFSGLKTAVRLAIEALPPGDLLPRDRADLAASFQSAASDVLIDRTERALALFCADYPASRTLVVAGGVAANRSIRSRLLEAAKRAGCRLAAPAPSLCTDNGAMIAWAGLERLQARGGLGDPLDFPCRPRWPLESLEAA